MALSPSHSGAVVAARAAHASSSSPNFIFLAAGAAEMSLKCAPYSELHGEEG